MNRQPAVELDSHWRSARLFLAISVQSFIGDRGADPRPRRDGPLTLRASLRWKTIYRPGSASRPTPAPGSRSTQALGCDFSSPRSRLSPQGISARISPKIFTPRCALE